jgi:acyl carrier protein
MTREDIARRTEAFVRKQFSVAPTDTGFTRTAPLFELGYVDSVGVTELLAFLSEEFGVEVSNDELLSEDFQTLDGIAGIVDRCRAGAQPAPWSA